MFTHSVLACLWREVLAFHFRAIDPMLVYPQTLRHRGKVECESGHLVFVAGTPARHRINPGTAAGRLARHCFPRRHGTGGDEASRRGRSHPEFGDRSFRPATFNGDTLRSNRALREAEPRFWKHGPHSSLLPVVLTLENFPLTLLRVLSAKQVEQPGDS